jgi:hypothetical protein
MARYAEGTTVPAEHSRREVERVLERYGASGFGYAWDRFDERACGQSWCRSQKRPIAECEAAHKWEIRLYPRELVHVTFRLHERVVRLDVPMPCEVDEAPRGGWTKARLEAATRQRWRALVLVLKAKLEAVDAGISTLEQEFLANVVMEDGRTIGQAIIPRLSEAVSAGRLLPAAGETTR